MHRIIAWFASNPVAANLLMVAAIAGGLLSLPQLKQEVIPEVDLGRASVRVAYPGASPADVEDAIVVRIEEQLQGVEGIERLTATAREGVGSVTAEFLEEVDTRRVLDDIRTRIDAITSFPALAEEPVIQEVESRRQVVNIAVWGDAEERTLRRVGERVRDALVAQPEISQAELVGVRPYEISIEVSENELRRHGLSFDEVVRAVEHSSLDLPGGVIDAPGGDVQLRVIGQGYRGADFEALPLRTAPDGTRLLLGEVAQVVDGFRDLDRSARFNGRPAVLVELYRVGNQSALAVSAATRRVVEAAATWLPEGIHLTLWQDDTNLLRSRRDLLLRNGRDGFCLIVLVLALFLTPRVALWVAAGVPIALLGTLWWIPAWDISINMASLFAFIVVLGILVDDAIVTGENIHRHQQRDPDPLRAAIRGTQEIATPVIFGVLTTMAAFTPMLFLSGAMGRLVRAIPVVVLSALVWSLIESKLVLPAHLAHPRRSRRRRSAPRGGFLRGAARLRAGLAHLQDRVAWGLEFFVAHIYTPQLRRCLRWRYLSAACGAAIFAVVASWSIGGHLPFHFLPHVEADNVVAFLSMPEGTPAPTTVAAVGRIEEAARQLRAELAAEGYGASAIRHILATVGEQPFRNRARPPGSVPVSASGSQLGEVNIELAPAAERAGLSGETIAERWRERSGEIPDAVELQFSSDLFPAGSALDVEFQGRDVAVLQRIGEALALRLAATRGVVDVATSFRAGVRELHIALRPTAEVLGVSTGDLARQVRQAFYGHEVQRVQRGRDELRIMVRYPAAERRSLVDLENLRIRTPDGRALAFGDVARAEWRRGESVIRRSDRQRVVHVTAEIDPAHITANQVIEDLRHRVLPDLLATHPDVTVRFGGEQREQSRTAASFVRGFLLAAIAIFALLAVPLRSYLQPLIIMSAIPYGVVGAVLGHLITRQPHLSMLSVIGILAAVGVVVNDSLVLVSRVNERRSAGLDIVSALQEACRARFRAIFLTSITTFVGLSPIMLERSVQAQFLIPMAVSLAFGVLFATVATTLLVPAHYLILEDLRAAYGGSTPGAAPEGEGTG